MKFTRILAIRHGETTWNQDQRLQGQLDIPLNERGHWQAARAAEALREEPIAAVYSSDLARAHQTARAIAALQGLEVRPHTGLRERHFGAFQGKTWTELEVEEPEATLAWRTRVPDFAPGGGETLLQLRARIAAALDEIAACHAGEQIVVVAHGGVLDMVYRLATRLELQAPRTWAVENAAIHRLLWTREGLSLIGWADRSHLDDGTLDESAS